MIPCMVQVRVTSDPLQPKAVAESSPRQAMSAQRRGFQVGALVSDQPRTSRFTKKVSYFIL